MKTEKDVPGAILENKENLFCNSVIQLKQFLKCRGIRCSNLNKPALIERYNNFSVIISFYVCCIH